MGIIVLLLLAVVIGSAVWGANLHEMANRIEAGFEPATENLLVQAARSVVARRRYRREWVARDDSDTFDADEDDDEAEFFDGVDQDEISAAPYNDGSAIDPRWHEGDHGRRAAFSYINLSGDRSERIIRQWLSEGPYIHGWCEEARADRTFRKRKISNWRTIKEVRSAPRKDVKKKATPRKRN